MPTLSSVKFSKFEPVLLTVPYLSINFSQIVPFFADPITNGFCVTSNIKIFIIITFFKRVLSEYTEAITTSLIPLETILPEVWAFMIGFSCTVWTEMRSLLAL